MSKMTFVRKPFEIEATEITEENIEEIAAEIGTLSRKEDGTLFIETDRKIPNIRRAYVGFFVAKMGRGERNTRVYAPAVFKEQFVPKTERVEAALGDLIVQARKPRESKAEAPETKEAGPVVEISSGTKTRNGASMGG